MQTCFFFLLFIFCFFLPCFGNWKIWWSAGWRKNSVTMSHSNAISTNASFWRHNVMVISDSGNVRLSAPQSFEIIQRFDFWILNFFVGMIKLLMDLNLMSDTLYSVFQVLSWTSKLTVLELSLCNKRSYVSFTRTFTVTRLRQPRLVSMKESQFLKLLFVFIFDAKFSRKWAIKSFVDHVLSTSRRKTFCQETDR